MTKLKQQETVRHAKATTKQFAVKLSQLNVDTKNDFCHRSNNYNSDDNVSGLAKNIVSEGLHTPIMVAEAAVSGDGVPLYRIIGGHRRFAALQLAINQQLDLKRVHPEMEVSVVLVEPEEAQSNKDFEQDLMVKSIGDNANRNDLSNDERLEIVRKCRHLGIPDPRAALALGMSDSQYKRLAAVVASPWLLDLVKANCIGMTHAATLVMAAKNPQQAELLRHGLERWVNDKRVVLERERADQAKLGRKLTGNANSIKKYLDAKLVKHWISCIEDIIELDDDPSIDFGVLVDHDKGTVTIPAIKIDIHEHARPLLVKIIGELTRGAEGSVELLHQKELLEAARSMSTADRLTAMQKVRSEYDESVAAAVEADAGREPKETFAVDQAGDLDSFDLEDESFSKETDA
jgi:ParB-like chromosome segregation protein Spo0J